ncbi:MAG: fructose-specific PTS transporter subunit EIIC [Faecalibacterium sp.]
MRITELFTAQSIALDIAAKDRGEIIDRLVELQATHGNITNKEQYKKALYAREEEASTYVDNGITVPHAKTACVTRPSLAALRLTAPVQYNPEDDGKTDLLFAIAAPENGSLHVDMLARMMQMLMNEDFVETLRAAKTPAEFLAAIDAQEDAQFGQESFTEQVIPQSGYRILAVTACPNGIAHTYMAAEALTKAGAKLGLPTKVETNGSDGKKNILTREEIAACDGIIVAADKNVETARFDGKPVLFARVDDGIHKPEELIKKVAHGEVPVYHAKGGAQAEEGTGSAGDTLGHTIYKHLMNGVSHMLPFIVGGGIMIALAFLLDDYSIDPANFGMNTPLAAFFKTVGGAAFGYMLPILAGFIAMSIADRPGLAVGFAGGVLAMNGTNFADLANGQTTGISGGFLAALLAGFVAGYIVLFLERITEKLPASLNGIRPMLIYPLGGILAIGAVMCGVNPLMGIINTAMTDWLNALGGTSRVLLGAIVAGMMSVDMGGPVNKAAYVFGTAALASGNFEVMAAVMVGGMVPPIAIALSTTFCPRKWTPDERRNGIVNYVMGLCFVSEGAIPYAAADPLRVLPSCVAGAALSGALSMVFGCALRAPHGGIFVFPVVDHALLYCVALAAGSVLGAVLLSLLKKDRTDTDKVQ